MNKDTEKYKNSIWPQDLVFEGNIYELDYMEADAIGHFKYTDRARAALKDYYEKRVTFNPLEHEQTK